MLYDIKIAHISSNENISDYSSRHPFTQSQKNKQYFQRVWLDMILIKQTAKNDKTETEILDFRKQTFDIRK